MFAPPRWYDFLVIVCVVGGLLLSALAFIFGLPLFIIGPEVLWWAALLVVFAGLWAALSSERMICDLRNRTYMRLEGQAIGKRITRGSLHELDALVLLTEESPVGIGRTVIYRLVLHWKGQRLPLMVVEREERTIGSGQPLSVAAGPILERGVRFAQALAVPFYDNSHFRSPPPVPVR
jgi:hypothetical protein